MYLSLDDGPSTKEIDNKDREELRWCTPNEVEEMLSYQDLKDLWKKAFPSIAQILK